jgi:hypothetical protein
MFEPVVVESIQVELLASVSRTPGQRCINTTG